MNPSQKCPFHAQLVTTEKKETASEITRRHMLAWSSMLGGLVAVGLGGAAIGCAGASDEGETSGNALEEKSFLQQYDELADPDPAKRIPAQGKLVSEWIQHHGEALFAELRANRPVLVTGGTVPVLVANYVDVVEVLKNNTTFLVKPYQNVINTNLPPNGLEHFSLSDTDLGRHDKEKKAFVEAMKRDRYGVTLRNEAEALVAAVQARKDGKLDVIRDVATLLPITVLDSYFGVPSGAGKPLGQRDLYDLIAKIFRALFMNLPNDKPIQAAGEAAAKDLFLYVETLVKARKATMTSSSPMPDDVLGKFVWFQVSSAASPASKEVFATDERVVANLCGIVTGAVVGFAQAIGYIIDVLTTPKHAAWSGAVDAANRNDTGKVWAYCQEALRLRPQGIGLGREASEATTLSKAAIPKGSLVIASHASAMMDPKKVPEPEKFTLNRRPESYLHFGYARYKCLGQDLAPLVITEAVRAMLRVKGLQRAESQVIEFTDAYPTSFVLTHQA